MVRVIAKGGVKPTGRVYTGRSDLGDGDNCPLGDHGKMYVVGKNRQWCPHSDHSKGELTRCFWPLYDLAIAVEAYHGSKTPPELGDIDISALES